jgi:hypothetical protein
MPDQNGPFITTELQQSSSLPVGNSVKDVNTRNKDLSIQNDMHNSCGCGAKNSGDHLSDSEIKSSPKYVYAIGKVTHRFPNRSIEMEYAQAMGRVPEIDTKGLTDAEVMSKTLTDSNNRYLARQICYVFNIENLETYVLVPSDPYDIDKLTQALRPSPERYRDIDVIIGRRGPLSCPEKCNGLILPIVIVDQIYSFDRDVLMNEIPKRKGENQAQFRKTSDSLFDNLLQIADNAGGIDEHRALNYLAVRYAEIYNRTQLMQDENYSLSSVDVRPSYLSGARKIVDVIFSFEHRTNRAGKKYFVRVDVDGLYPFLVSPMQEYFQN